MIELSPDVAQALAEGAPVVALESTIIAHGFPHPQNRELAHELEAAVRDAGAVPATIAVLSGVARVGLDARGLERIAAPSTAPVKAAARDLPAVMARREDAATTVSATALLASRAGLRVFATGGIGGVHRDDPADVSADLVTMARLPIAVISAGPKAILDVHRTGEALESLGILVIGLQTGELPLFYCRTSGIPLEHRAETAAEVADILHVRFDELAEGGVLVANPPPADAAIEPDVVEEWIAEAHRRADARRIRGKALTPFLLAELADVSDGATVTTNRALAVANARCAAEIAVAYAQLGA